MSQVDELVRLQAQDRRSSDKLLSNYLSRQFPSKDCVLKTILLYESCDAGFTFGCFDLGKQVSLIFSVFIEAANSSHIEANRSQSCDLLETSILLLVRSCNAADLLMAEDKWTLYATTSVESCLAAGAFMGWAYFGPVSCQRPRHSCKAVAVSSLLLGRFTVEWDPLSIWPRSHERDE